MEMRTSYLRQRRKLVSGPIRLRRPFSLGTLEKTVLLGTEKKFQANPELEFLNNLWGLGTE